MTRQQLETYAELTEAEAQIHKGPLMFTLLGMAVYYRRAILLLP